MDDVKSEHVGHNPPEGWFAFGTHVDRPGPLEFSTQTDDAGMPLWERPVVVNEHVSPAQIAVETFNDLNPVGVRVRYWPGALVGEGVESVTRSAAWLLGGHTPVVMVEGYAGGIALSHVIARPSPIRGGEVT